MDLKITCTGADTVPLDSLTDMQGNLKTLSEADEVKLRNSFIKYGFSFPCFVWLDKKEGVYWTIDSHQRQKVLRKMRTEGWKVPPLPVDYIHAENRTEAKEKLLLANSRYGVINEEGMEEFLNEEGFEIDSTEIGDTLSFPEIGFGAEDENVTSGKENNAKESETLTCPSCKYSFTRKEMQKGL